MEQYATFLAATVLVASSFIVIIMALVIVNNLLHKYWNKLNTPNWFGMNNHYRFADETELQAASTQVEPKLIDPKTTPTKSKASK